MSLDNSSKSEKTISKNRSRFFTNLKEQHFLNYINNAKKRLLNYYDETDITSNGKSVKNTISNSTTHFPSNLISPQNPKSKPIIIKHSQSKKKEEDLSTLMSNSAINLQYSYYCLSPRYTIKEENSKKINIVNTNFYREYLKHFFHVLQNKKPIDFPEHLFLQKTFSKLKGKTNLTKSKYTYINDYFKNNQTKYLLVRKQKDRIPYIFPTSFTFCNKYASQSEHSRHRKLLEEMDKLKGVINRKGNNTLECIKNFLSKYMFFDINKYSDDQILNFKRVLNTNYQLINPSKSIKSIFTDILEYKGEWKENEEKFSYISPNLKQRTSFKIIKPHINKNIYNRKNLKSQQTLYIPEKNYINNRRLLVKEIGTEIKEIKKKIHTQRNPHKLMNNYSKSLSFIITLNEKKEEKKLKKSKSSLRLYSKHFVNKCVHTNCFISQTMGNEDKKKRNLKDITQRLYYNEIEKKPITVKDLKKQKKLTEYAAFTSLRNKMFIEDGLKNLFKN